MKRQLTPREKEVLNLASQGNTSKEIGEHLFISAWTVRVHVISLRNKLDAKSITHAVRLGIENGDIALSDEAAKYIGTKGRLRNGIDKAIDEHQEHEEGDLSKKVTWHTRDSPVIDVTNIDMAAYEISQKDLNKTE